MTALYILGGIVLTLALLGVIPVGVELIYNEEGLSLRVRAAFVSFAPGAKKEKPKKHKPKKEKPQKEKPETKTKGLPPLPLVLSLFRRGVDTLLRLIKRFRFELVKLHVIAAAPDPADTAALYAAAGLGLEMLLRLGGGRIGKCDLRADIDFDAQSPVIDLHLRVTLRLGAALGAAVRFGLGFIGDYLQYKRKG